MVGFVRRVLPLAVLVAAASLVGAQDVANPYYTFWSREKPGATAVYKETTRLSGAETADVRTVTYKLAELNDREAVVETRVLKQETFGFVGAAPGLHVYPARMSRALLEEVLEETGAKGVAAVLKVGDRELDVMALSGSLRKGGREVDFKLWLSDEVPGAFVKRVRTTKVNGEVVAETAMDLVAFTAPARGALPPADGLAAPVVRVRSLEPGAGPTPCARITVRLPAAARLYADGVPCPLTGETRTFDTPRLEPGVRYTYLLNGEVTWDGVPLTVSRRIFMRAGEEVVVDLRDLFK